MNPRHLARRRLAALILAVALTRAALACAAEVWPHPRGPLRNGVIADSGMPAGNTNAPTVLWRRWTGQGFSGFAIESGRFYTQFQTPAGQHVAGYELDTGRELWRARYGLPWELDGSWPGPYASPVLDDGALYYAGCFGEVGCVQASDGRSLWTINVQELFAGDGTEFGYACTPLIDEGRLFLPVGGANASVIALEATTGRLLWKAGSDSASYCGSLAITVAGHRQIVSYLQNVTVAHDPATGRELWRHARGRGYAEHAAWPLWSPPYLFYAEPFLEGAYVLHLDYDGDQPRMREVWHDDVLCHDIFSSVIVDGHVYGFDITSYQAVPDGRSEGSFKCVELATGRECWAATNTGHAMVLTDRTNLLIFNEDGEFILADATPERYRERSRTRVFEGPQCWTVPAYHDGRLLIRARTNLVCLYLGDTNSPDFARLTAAAGAMVTRARQPGVFERFRSDAFFAPTTRDLAAWSGASLIGVIFPVLLLACLLRGWIGRRFWLIELAIGMVALLGCPAFTVWREHLVFTWPVAVHVVFFWAVRVCLDARGTASRRADWAARGALLVLVGVCLGYHELCRRNFIVMGWGFLVGLLPALPVAVIGLSTLRGFEQPLSPRRFIGAWLLSFIGFFGAAAWFIRWRT